MTCVYLLLCRDDEVLLLRRANTGYQDGNYGLVAGHIEGNELLTEAMVREAKEEAGIDINASDLELVHTAHRLDKSRPDQERIDIFFRATTWKGEIVNAEPEVCDDLSWFSMDSLPDNMIPFVKLVIQDVHAGKIFSEYEDEPV